jgi:hypothetical protein
LGFHEDRMGQSNKANGIVLVQAAEDTALVGYQRSEL